MRAPWARTRARSMRSRRRTGTGCARRAGATTGRRARGAGRAPAGGAGAAWRSPGAACVRRARQRRARGTRTGMRSSWRSAGTRGSWPAGGTPGRGAGGARCSLCGFSQSGTGHSGDKTYIRCSSTGRGRAGQGRARRQRAAGSMRTGTCGRAGRVCWLRGSTTGTVWGSWRRGRRRRRRIGRRRYLSSAGSCSLSGRMEGRCPGRIRFLAGGLWQALDWLSSVSARPQSAAIPLYRPPLQDRRPVSLMFNRKY